MSKSPNERNEQTLKASTREACTGISVSRGKKVKGIFRDDVAGMEESVHDRWHSTRAIMRSVIKIDQVLGGTDDEEYRMAWALLRLL